MTQAVTHHKHTRVRNVAFKLYGSWGVWTHWKWQKGQLPCEHIFGASNCAEKGWLTLGRFHSNGFGGVLKKRDWLVAGKSGSSKRAFLCSNCFRIWSYPACFLGMLIPCCYPNKWNQESRKFNHKEEILESVNSQKYCEKNPRWCTSLLLTLFFLHLPPFLPSSPMPIIDLLYNVMASVNI